MFQELKILRTNIKLIKEVYFLIKFKILKIWIISIMNFIKSIYNYKYNTFKLFLRSLNFISNSNLFY